MGACCGVTRRFQMDAEKEGQDEAAVEVFRLLGLTEHDVDLLFTAYYDIDADNSGVIRPEEFFAYFQVESTPFEKSIFNVFDEDKSGEINFMEFVCSLWNLLTLPERDIGALAYLIKDPSGTGRIGYTAVRDVLETMHKKTIESVSSLLELFNAMRRAHQGDLNMAEFLAWTSANGSLVAPLMMLQLHFQRQIIGESFWVHMSEDRAKHPEMGQITYIGQLQKTVTAQNATFKVRQQEIEAERRRLSRLGKGRMGDTRDNVARKQSRLLSFYQLKQRLTLRRRAVYADGDTELVGDHPKQRRQQQEATEDAEDAANSKTAVADEAEEEREEQARRAQGKKQAFKGRRRSRSLILRPKLTRDEEQHQRKLQQAQRGKRSKPPLTA